MADLSVITGKKPRSQKLSREDVLCAIPLRWCPDDYKCSLPTTMSDRGDMGAPSSWMSPYPPKAVTLIDKLSLHQK